jgi:ABC-type multidrug transport system ATPase subunit
VLNDASWRQPPILEIIDLCKSFGAVCDIDHLSLWVQTGEIVGILGPAGAGKTSLFELLSGKAAPTRGIIKVAGRDVWRKSKPAFWYVGAVPIPQRDLNSAGEDSTAREHLQFHAELLGVPSLKYPQRISTTLEVVGLAAYEHIQVPAFSAEMKQRLAFARALLHDPALLLVDEPSAGVALYERQIIWNLLRSLREAGKSVVLMTPSWEEALAACDRVALLTDGRLQRVVTRPKHLMQAPWSSACQEEREPPADAPWLDETH